MATARGVTLIHALSEATSVPREGRFISQG
jgi:hypothetical protein